MKKLIGLILVFAIFFSVFGVSYAEWREEKLKELSKATAKEDLMANSYESIRISLLPTEDFSEGYIALFSGTATKEVDYRFQNLEEMYTFMEEVYPTQMGVYQIYLYLDPIAIAESNLEKKVDTQTDYEDHLEALFSLYEETRFACVLPAYSVQYWEDADGRVTAKEEELLDFVKRTDEHSNVETFFLGFEEWLINNPGNYVSGTLNNSDIHALLTGLVMRDVFLEERKYLVTTETLEEKLELTREVCEKVEGDVYADLSKLDVVLIGDSILGNYTDSASVAGVIEGFTGANVYICAQGGATAAPTKEFPFNFEDMVRRFLVNSVEDLDDCTFKSEVEKFHTYAKSKREKVFILNFGINDYYRGIDIADFEASYRNGIQSIKEAYPEAEIVVMGANFVTMYNNGEDLFNENTKGLVSYVDVTEKVAKEEGTFYLDNYQYFLEMVEEKLVEDVDDLLADKTHPNEDGRYLIGQRIIKVISDGIEIENSKKTK